MGWLYCDGHCDWLYCETLKYAITCKVVSFLKITSLCVCVQLVVGHPAIVKKTIVIQMS